MNVTWNVTVRYWTRVPLGKAYCTFLTKVEAPENDLRGAAQAGVIKLLAHDHRAQVTRIDVARIDAPAPATAPDQRQMGLW